MNTSISEKLLSVQDTLINKAYLIGAWMISGSLTVPGWVGADGRDFSDRASYFFLNITVMEFLGFVAMMLLIIERCFVVWARFREWRRHRSDGTPWAAIFTVLLIAMVSVWLYRVGGG